MRIKFPDLFLAFSIYYIFAAVIYSWFQGNEKIHWASVYILFIISGLSILISKDLLSKLRRVGVVNRGSITSLASGRGYLRYTLALALFVSFWLWRNKYYFVWYDETTQFFTGIFPQFKWHVTEFAAFQQQPPLDYYISAFAREILGTNLFAVRVHSVAFFLCAIVLAAYASLKKRLPLWIFFPWLVIFLSQAEVAQYTLEARPIAIGIFFSYLVFLYSDRMMNAGNNSRIRLTSSALLLLLSLGYQSCIFLVSLAFSQSFMKGRKEVYQIWKYTVFIPGLLCSPVWLYIIYVSIGLNQFHESDLLGTASKVFFIDFKERAFRFYEAGQGAWISLFIILGISLIIAFWKKTSKKHVENFISLIVFGALYPLLTLITWSFINWPFFHKYFTLWISGVAFLFLGLLSSTNRLALRGYGGKLLVVPVFLVSLYFCMENFLPYQRFRLVGWYGARPDWNQFIEEVEGLNIEKKNYIYLTTSDRPSEDWYYLAGRLFETVKNRWAYIGFYRGEFFFQLPENYESDQSKGDWVVFINADFLQDPKVIWNFTLELAAFGKIKLLNNNGILLHMDRGRSMDELLVKHFKKIQLSKKASSEFPL